MFVAEWVEETDTGMGAYAAGVLSPGADEAIAEADADTA